MYRAANWIAWCQEKPFHPKQLTRLEDEGRRLRVVINRCNADEVISRLLRFGVDFEMVRPDDLRDRVVAIAEQIARRHSGRSSLAPTGDEMQSSPTSP